MKVSMGNLLRAAAVLDLVVWCWAGIRRFMQGIGKKCRDELSFPCFWGFFLQRS